MLLSFLMLFVAVGTLIICLSLPLIYGKVPPNRLYGIVLQRTLDDPEVWYLVNAYTARRLLWVGITTILAAVLAYFIPNITLDQYTTFVGVVNGIGLAIMLIQMFIYLKRLPTAEAGDSDSGETETA